MLGENKDARDPLKFLILENASDNKALCVNNLVLKWTGTVWKRS